MQLLHSHQFFSCTIGSLLCDVMVLDLGTRLFFFFRHTCMLSATVSNVELFADVCLNAQSFSLCHAPFFCRCSRTVASCSSLLSLSLALAGLTRHPPPPAVLRMTMPHQQPRQKRCMLNHRLLLLPLLLYFISTVLENAHDRELQAERKRRMLLFFLSSASRPFPSPRLRTPSPPLPAPLPVKTRSATPPPRQPSSYDMREIAPRRDSYPSVKPKAKSSSR